MSSPQKPLTARERARIEFTAEIKAVARRQLAESGAAALSLRAVARELGLATPSALYRYFPGRDALLTALILDAYTSLGAAAEAAYAALDGADEEPVEALEHWVGVCHAVRDWALAHPHEYALIYGSPVPGYAAPQDTVAQATRVPYLIGTLFTDPPGQDGHRPGETRPAMPDDARQSLAPLLAGLPPDTPADRVMGSLMAWTYLFGAISFELFGHRSAIVADPRAFFDHEARRLGTALGLAG
ncbi:TetR/AcrR family transcriptional regulator [Streptomyces aureus]|uniref:TetR/AcrR family transcriptional regulator n=1 Tax=Streptomyces aureus TaxID=193461 RepID=UPI00055FBCDA|nr:TetR/AcrR family transcriptional regulator [Streptomyces aureus]